jgi:class 3 adenylate cyclase
MGQRLVGRGSPEREHRDDGRFHADRRGFRGRLVKYTGDGVLATFGSASDAIGCATALVPVVGRLGVDIHSGIHVGDIERHRDDIGGTAVNVAARVMDSAGRREVLVTSSARDAAAGLPPVGGGNVVA